MAALARVEASAEAKVFRLDGGRVTYAIGVDEKGYLAPVYWGPSLDGGAPLAAREARETSGFDPAGLNTAQEYPGQGEGLVTEPGVKVAFADGNRDLVLKYVSHRLEGDTLIVELADIARPLDVTLRYRIDPNTGILARSAVIRNAGKSPVRLDQVAAAVFTLPAGDDYRLHYLTGDWGAEWTQNVQPVTPALAVIESRRGSTSHQANPWFAVDRAGKSDDQSGPVWFGALGWSGSWRISVGADAFGRVRIAGGWNPYDFSWTLKPGERLETPIFYAGYTDSGTDGASRLLHRFERASILPHGESAPLRPVLYNSWEATTFNVDEAGQMALAERAAKIGVERFVMDDGWFGARNDDHAGLGDWFVNRTKFPNGLKPLIDRVHALGMSFGLWVEPEMVNPDSDLYRAHPDWVMNFPGRPRTEARNQLVLNLARPEVRDHILKTLDDLVSKNDIQFLKWDYNRNWTEPGWPEAGPQDEQRIYVDYVRNLYAILAELRRRHPKLEIETCSGGGGRIDLGILGLTDEAWTSDNTDPFDRLTIQDGYTRAYPASTMMAWVTDSPNFVNQRSTSLDYRFLSAMQGSLGIGANLNRWADADFATAAKWIGAYKAIRSTVQRGDRYRLIPPEGHETSATLFVAPDRRQAVLFQMLQSSSHADAAPMIHPQGLDAGLKYRVRMLGGAALPVGMPAKASGAWWMGQGIRAPLQGDFQGAAFVFDAE
ncbi:alpha-galactosidase [Sphingomonas oryzagri]|uniref:Alpha-galactosidase n=1 Tax=Sphingomonas oryzagri TaxID=3042314 RepID=A0ABT6N234_9SPHN|nr:alpha-galactosidase [Sphingomonas oryzagri]MDH7639344.1 alpha-galactosidase [Sphingomonas oryzagri]